MYSVILICKSEFKIHQCIPYLKKHFMLCLFFFLYSTPIIFSMSFLLILLKHSFLQKKLSVLGRQPSRQEYLLPKHEDVSKFISLAAS